MSTSGCADLSRRPSSSKALFSRDFSAVGTASHSRIRSGPWLAAKAPAKLAMAQAPHELLVLHAGGEEVVAQQVGVRALREERHVVLGQRLAHFGADAVAIQDLVALGAVFRRRGRPLQVIEELGQPVVAHGPIINPISALTYRAIFETGIPMFSRRWATSPRVHEVLVERDVKVRMPDGTYLDGNVYRPASPGR